MDDPPPYATVIATEVHELTSTNIYDPEAPILPTAPPIAETDDDGHGNGHSFEMDFTSATQKKVLRYTKQIKRLSIVDFAFSVFYVFTIWPYLLFSVVGSYWGYRGSMTYRYSPIMFYNVNLILSMIVRTILICMDILSDNNDPEVHFTIIVNSCFIVFESYIMITTLLACTAIKSLTNAERLELLNEA